MATKAMTVMRQGTEDFTINDPNIADEFSSSADYAMGEYCNYQGNLYTFIVPHPAGSWNSSHVAAVLLNTEMISKEASVRTDINKSAKDKIGIEYIEDAEISLFDWEYGAISGTGADYDDNNYIRNAGYAKFDGAGTATAKVSGNFAFGVRMYKLENGTYRFLGASSSTDNTEYVLPDLSYYYRFVIKSTNSAVRSTEWGKNFTVATTTKQYNVLKTALTSNELLIHKMHLRWVIGGISYTGADATSTKHIRTDYLNLDDIGAVKFTPNAGYTWKYHEYTKSGDVYTNVANNSLTGDTEIIRINPGHYYRFSIGNTDSSVTAGVDTFSENVNITGYPSEEKLLEGEEKILVPGYEVLNLPFTAEYQNFCGMGDYFVFGTGSTAYGGTANGKIYIVKKSDLTLTKTLNHNLGHISQFCYDSENDLLMLSNTESASDPTLWIIHSASGILSYNDGADVLVSGLSVDTISLSDLESTYGSMDYVIGCWYGKVRRGNPFVLVNGQFNTKWAMIMLGKGTTQLDKGTYNSSNNGFNGTYKVIWFKVCPYHAIPYRLGINDGDICQGMCEYKGKIITQSGHTPITGAVYQPQLNETVYRETINIPWLDDNGDQLDMSDGWYGEGCAVIDGDLYFGITQGYLLKMEM